MLVRHFMSVGVYTLSPDAPCAEVLKMFRAKKIRRAPVLEHGKLVGMISERDLLRILPGTAGQLDTEAGALSLSVPVRQIMTTQIHTVRPQDPLHTAAQLMLQHRIGGLPVVDNDEVRGMLTESDVFRALWSVLAPDAGACIVIEEPPSVAKTDAIDFAKLAVLHGCRLRALIDVPQQDGGRYVHVCVDGAKLDAFVDAVWKQHARVMRVDKHGAP